MATATQSPVGVHLVGSVPLESNTAVFELVSSVLGTRVWRIPDGETGDRANWIGWQFPRMAAMSIFETVPPPPNRYPPIPTVKLREGANVDALVFPDLGYSQAAKDSYAEFSRLKQAGVIPPGIRFQVCLPTPLAPVHAFVEPEHHAQVEPAYEKQLLAELDDILAAIPAHELAIQWDTAVEFGLLEGVWPTRYADVESAIIERLLRLGNHVPAAVELGYHLCYGDSEHKHFKEPDDTSKLVTIANAIAAGLERPLHWIHLPVPRDRNDAAYFAPLRDLQLQPETELYLGLVHFTDGVEGTQKRIAAAQQAVSTFGVATECGFGRRPADTIPDLLAIHADVSAPIQ